MSETQPTNGRNLKIQVLIPCFNEAATIRKVVGDFRACLPEAEILVYDNNSTDDTAREAAAAGARVIPSPLQGKGNVVRHMFDDVDADYSIMVDGDDTYPATGARVLLGVALETRADMVVGLRLERFSSSSFRRFHHFGNHLISGLISRLFGVRVVDALSGYRVFSREFARNALISSAGFEVETELTLHAITKRCVFREVPIEYGTRPAGSESKLNTFRDGALIVSTIVLLFRDYKPLLFFASVAGVLAVLSLAAGSLPIIEYYRTGLVPHFPRAILASGLAVCSLVSLAMGIGLDTLNKYYRENFELHRKLMRAVQRMERKDRE